MASPALEAAAALPDAEPEIPDEDTEAPESLYAIRRRRAPRWIPDSSSD